MKGTTMMESSKAIKETQIKMEELAKTMERIETMLTMLRMQKILRIITRSTRAPPRHRKFL
jgi:hypothetical protein